MQVGQAGLGQAGWSEGGWAEVVERRREKADKGIPVGAEGDDREEAITFRSSDPASKARHLGWILCPVRHGLFLEAIIRFHGVSSMPMR